MPGPGLAARSCLTRSAVATTGHLTSFEELPDVPGTDTFTSGALGHRWEWNHNPDNSRWSTGSGPRLQTATVTNDLYGSRSTLTHRIQGPSSTATIELDYAQMANGDRAGLAMLGDQSAWIGVKRDNGTEQAGANVSGGRIWRPDWLRVTAELTIRDLQLTHPVPRRRGDRAPLRPDHPLTSETK